MLSSRTTRKIPPNSKEQTLDVRLTCDCRTQNKVIRRTRYPSKTVEYLVYMVQGARISSKLDITKAFHQLMLHEDSRHLTTVTTHIGLFRYRRLHMKISNVSEEFTEAVRVILLGLPGQANMTDDILIYGKHEPNIT